jgi:hypothetical protein
MSRKFLGSRSEAFMTETKTTFSVDIVRVEFNLNGLPDNSVHITGFRGKDERSVELNAVTLCAPESNRVFCKYPSPGMGGRWLALSVPMVN